MAIFGIGGRMGQSLLLAIREGTEFRVSGALASAASRHLGEEAAGVRVTGDCATALKGAEVALDFSAPGAVAEHAQACVEAGVPLLVGTTGLQAQTWAALQHFSSGLPILVAPNTSLAVAMLSRLVATAAAGLGADYDAEIFEAHHRHKRDAPSGTALSLGEVVARARGTSLSQAALFERHGQTGPRPPGSIGFAVMRGGDIVGEHTVTFAAAGERLELTHKATDRGVFARGALTAAAWLAGRNPGFYAMQDVLPL